MSVAWIQENHHYGRRWIANVGILQLRIYEQTVPGDPVAPLFYVIECEGHNGAPRGRAETLDNAMWLACALAHMVLKKITQMLELLENSQPPRPGLPIDATPPAWSMEIEEL
jgi:hypothetical protein